MNRDAAGMLGILNRAGLIAFGPAVEGSLRKGHLLLLAKDASPSALRRYASVPIPIYYVNTKEELGAPLGRDELSAVLVLSAKGAKSLLSKLQKGETQ